MWPILKLLILISVIHLSSPFPESNDTNDSEETPESRRKIKLKLRVPEGSNVKLSYQFNSVLQGDIRLKIRIKIKQQDIDRISNECSSKEFYASMLPSHMSAVGDIYNIIDSGKTTLDALDIATELRNRSEINRKAWYRGLLNYAYTNQDLEGVHKLSPVQALPDLFLPKTIMDSLKSSGYGRAKPCIVLDESLGHRNGAENKLWYFRENIFLNVHHLFYHVANPWQFRYKSPDRRGELFWYMHHAVLARYNVERIANGLGKTKVFKPVHEAIIEEGYYPNLADEISGKSFADRPPNIRYTDMLHAKDKSFPFTIYINQMEKSVQRLNSAIQNGFIQDVNGRKISLNNWKAIDIIGDIIQASNQSINNFFYNPLGTRPTGLHNAGHLIIGTSVDPHYQTRIPPGVMSDEGTAMRDPIFYRWHGFIDDFFDRFQRRLPPYTPTGGEFPLLWKGITVSDFKIQSKKTNEIQTFFTFSKLKLTYGVDFDLITNNGGASACIKHLDHDHFYYSFVVDRHPMVKSTKATARIFMVPVLKAKGKPIDLIDLRPFIFVMDTFTINLRPGKNKIIRNSTQSAVTLRSKQDVYELLENEENVKVSYCGCGFPHQLLVPKGTAKGMEFETFLMLTDDKLDSVDEFCLSKYIFCGVPGRKYPDKMPMGYPFDRLPYKVRDGGVHKHVQCLEDYAKGIGNIATGKVTIKFTGTKANRCCQNGK